MMHAPSVTARPLILPCERTNGLPRKMSDFMTLTNDMDRNGARLGRNYNAADWVVETGKRLLDGR